MPAVPAVAVAASKATAAAPAAAEPRVATSGGPQRTVSADVSKVLSALLAQVEQETSLPPPAAATSAASKGTAGTTPEAKGHGTVTAPRAEFPVGVNDGAVVMTGGESLQPSKDSTPAVKGGANPEARSDTSTAFSSTYSTHEQAQTNKPPCSTADIDNLLAELLADVSASVMRAPAAHPASTSPSASGSAKQSDQPSQQLSAFNQDAAKAKSLLSSSQPVSPGTLELGAGTAGMADFECAEPAEHAEQVMLGVDEEIAGLISSADVPEGSRSHSVVPDVRPANGTALQQTLDMVTDTVMERLVAGAEAGQQPASHMATAMDSGRHGMPSMAAGLNSEQHSTPSTTGGISNVQHSKASTAAAPLLPQADSSLELLHESAGTKSVGHALLGLDEEMAGLAPPEVAEPAGPAMLDLDDEMAGLAPPEHAEPAKPAVLGLHEDMAGRGGASDTLKAAATSGITKEGSDEAERVSADVNEAVANLTDAVIKAENAAGVQQNTGMVTYREEEPCTFFPSPKSALAFLLAPKSTRCQSGSSIAIVTLHVSKHV